MSKRYIRKNDIFQITEGCLSDLLIHGNYKALVDFDMHEQFLLWLNSQKTFQSPELNKDKTVLVYQINPKEQQELEFDGFLVDKGLIEWIEILEYRIGDYSSYYSPVDEKEIT